MKWWFLTFSLWRWFPFVYGLLWTPHPNIRTYVHNRYEPPIPATAWSFLISLSDTFELIHTSMTTHITHYPSNVEIWMYADIHHLCVFNNIEMCLLSIMKWVKNVNHEYSSLSLAQSAFEKAIRNQLEETNEM